MQNRLNALFKQIARNSEYSDRGNAVFAAKHQRNRFYVSNAQNDVPANNIAWSPRGYNVTFRGGNVVVLHNYYVTL